MNTKEEIREVGRWINQYWDDGHDIITSDVFNKELLTKCDLDPILYMGCKLIKRTNMQYLEMPEKYISDERIESAATIYNKEEA